MFATLPVPITKTLSIVRYRQSQKAVTEPDVNGNVVRRPDLQSTLTSSNMNQSLMFSAARYLEPDWVKVAYVGTQRHYIYANNTE